MNIKMTSRSAILATVAACSPVLSHASDAGQGSVTASRFGKLPDGQPVTLYTLRNAGGAEAKITNYGGIVTSLKVPDRDGKIDDVVLGYSNIDGYIKNVGNPYFGALIGRFGNRIGNAKFTLDGKTYRLPKNDGPNTLHGGTVGFDKVLWTGRPLASKDGPSVELTYRSKDGEMGFPGNLDVTAVYTLTNKNELRVKFTATTDKPTVVNLTQHSYFNLAGKGDILGHLVQIKSDKITPVGATLIPTGKFLKVDGTPFDFRKPVAIGARINADDQQLKFGKGYDHNFVTADAPGKLKLQAKITEPTTGRTLEVLSTAPGVQFYSGNFLDGSIVGKGGRRYNFRNGFCFEPQHFPDSPNKPQFPSTVLRPGETLKSTIVYRFGTK